MLSVHMLYEYYGYKMCIVLLFILGLWEANIRSTFLVIILILKCDSLIRCESLESDCSKFEDAVVYGDPDAAEKSCYRSSVDIQSVSKSVDYWLYTREQPDGVHLEPNTPDMMKGTTFNVKNPIKVLIHGYMGEILEKESLCQNAMKAYLHVGEFNVICVKWMRMLVDINYINAKLRVENIGYETAKVLNLITKNMEEGVENLHLIGHSLGAHIVGFIGKKLKDKIPRITGLDPAKPLYRLAGPEDRIDKTDAKIVDIIHTNAEILGLFGPLGDIDFYPNGGKTQTQCKHEDSYTAGACSHLSSIHYFTQSILVKNVFKAIQCENWSQYEANKCGESASINYMGEYVDQKQTGSYYLRVTEPYI